jgi:hypothetical protein
MKYINKIKEEKHFSMIQVSDEEDNKYIAILAGEMPVETLVDTGIINSLDNIPIEYLDGYTLYPRLEKDIFFQAVLEYMDARASLDEMINIVSDTLSYRRYCIEHYGNAIRSVDTFNFKKFLNEYNRCVTTWKLHGGGKYAKAYLRFIDAMWKWIKIKESEEIVI